ncbi:MAG: ABC transporter ATP-binding protein [Anaerolineae bacterium]|nr:ABC transporter ATP-binding protein [Anaerolineae bacterium]
MTEPLLSVQDLHVHFLAEPADGRGAGAVRAVDGVSFDLAAGQALAIVGETGSGKTSIGRALLGLHPPGSTWGSIRLAGLELVGSAEAEWRPLRWRRIAMAVQSAGTAFDPVYRIGEQIAEPMREHLGLPADEAATRAGALARRVGLEARHLRAYPHQLSGGEKQRAMLAMALSCEPEVLIVDEPTSGQDVLSRAQLLDLLRQVRVETGLCLILISHDLAAAAQVAERVAVLYAGKLVEVGTAREVLEQPRHPYTWGLLNAYPNMTTARDLRGIRGHSPDPSDPPSGCRFHPRCTQAVDLCRQAKPPLVEIGGRLIACHLGGLQTLLQASDLRKAFSSNGKGEVVTAVRGVSLEVYEGEVVALVGETGSGKTTLGRLLVGLLDADSGHVVFEGQDLAALNGRERKALRRRIQFVAQDPFDAISPRLTVAAIVREPLDVQRFGSVPERAKKVRDALRAVGLPAEPPFLERRAHELSGGQLQRVAIARALVLDPKMIVADEPVSMLDASEQAKVINLLKEVQSERGMGLLLVSHDLALVRKVADRILVMRQGQVVEGGPASRVVTRPQHEYTHALLQAAPALGWEVGQV